MDKKMSPVVHFELPYEDKSRMADFYSKAFGWKPNMLGEEMGNYVTLQTAEIDSNRMPLTVGQINGGAFARTKPDQGVSVVLAVADIKEAMKAVTEAGGVLQGSDAAGNMEPSMIPGIGLFMSFKDTEGNRGSMLQPLGM